MLQKIENYNNALAQLEAAVARYQEAPDDSLYRDGLIQRFEFTVELAWKSIKEYLEDQGMVLSIASPRGILREAFAAGVIADADAWNNILTARSLTSHVYDETAVSIARQICTEFLPRFRRSGGFTKHKRTPQIRRCLRIWPEWPKGGKLYDRTGETAQPRKGGEAEGPDAAGASFRAVAMPDNSRWEAAQCR